jgi:hypothetical protein
MNRSALAKRLFVGSAIVLALSKCGGYGTDTTRTTVTLKLQNAASTQAYLVIPSPNPPGETPSFVSLVMPGGIRTAYFGNPRPPDGTIITFAAFLPTRLDSAVASKDCTVTATAWNPADPGSTLTATGAPAVYTLSCDGF